METFGALPPPLINKSALYGELSYGLLPGNQAFGGRGPYPRAREISGLSPPEWQCLTDRQFEGGADLPFRTLNRSLGSHPCATLPIRFSVRFRG